MTGSDTIFALSSGALPSGVAVIRISGPQARFACETLAGTVPEPRRASLRRLVHDGLLLDRGIVLWIPGPRTVTGEDMLELHLHGGRAVVQSVSRALRTLPGLRPAEPGEFTRRAFVNGRIDLLEAESLGDLLEAETEAQRKLAVVGAEGRQGLLYQRWRERLLHARAMLEAELDFSDEADVPDSVSDAVWTDMEGLERELDGHLASAHKSEIVRTGLDVVILGAPNAGKSSLLNALAGRDVAIVSDEPGTTRDLVEVALDLGGYKVRVTDTAGLRDNTGTVEAIGIARALARADEADVTLWVEDATDPTPPPVDGTGRYIRLRTKGDLPEAQLGEAQLIVSVHDHASLNPLLDRLGTLAADLASGADELLPIRERHLSHLSSCKEHLARARAGAVGIELRAEELRLAADQLGRLTGAVDVEELLGAIFSRFCIGK